MLSLGVEAIKRFDPSKFTRQKGRGRKPVDSIKILNPLVMSCEREFNESCSQKNTATPATFIAIFRNGLQKVFPKNLKKDLA